MNTGRFRSGAFGLLLLGALALGALGGQIVTSSSPVARTAASVLDVPAAQAQSLRELETTADVAELVMPSVVNIFTSRTVSMENHPFLDDPFFRRFFDERGGEPEERESTSLGSGVIIGADGYVITNNHVVARAEEIQVSMGDGKEYYAEVIGTDELSDLALLRIEADDLIPIVMGDSDQLRIGEAVMAVGNPFGVGQTVTMGIVSAKGRAIGLIDYEDFIQTDAAINPGNSGGALVNMRGELVGVNSAILSRSGGSQGIGFAIPTSMAEVVIDNLREHGRVVRGFLGVQPQDLDSATAMSLGLDEDTRGVLISDVVTDSPADDAGLERYDVVVAMDGKPVSSATSFRNDIGHLPPGSEIELEIIREGRTRDKTVELAERPDQRQVSQNESDGESDLSLLEGLRVYDADSRAARQMNIPRDVEGPVVVEVGSRTPASRAGLQPGDVVLEVNRRSVETVSEFEREVRDAVRDDDGRPVALLVQRGGGTVLVAISPR